MDFSVVRRSTLTILAVLLSLGIRAPAAAQGTGRIMGLVTDSTSGRPIAGVDVGIAGRAQPRTVTDETGRFILTAVPLGLHEVVIEMVGYRTARIRDVRVRTNEPAEISVALVVAAFEVEGIVVEG